MRESNRLRVIVVQMRNDNSLEQEDGYWNIKILTNLNCMLAGE